MDNIKPVGATCCRLADVHVANNENNPPISTVDGEAIVTDSRIDADNLSKECALLQNVKEIKSIDDVMLSIKKAQVEGDLSSCYLSIEGNGMNNSDHYAFNIIDILNIHPSAKDLADFNPNAVEPYCLALQIIAESIAITDNMLAKGIRSNYSIEVTNDKSLTISCNYLTDLLKVRKNIVKIKKLLSKIRNKEHRDKIKQKHDKLFIVYLTVFEIIHSSFSKIMHKIKPTLTTEKYYSSIFQDLQIIIAFLNKNCELQEIDMGKKPDTLFYDTFSDYIANLCYSFTTIIFNTNETDKKVAFSMLLEEKNKQNIKKLLDILNSSSKFNLYGAEKISHFVFAYYNLTNIIFGNTTALNKQIKLFRDNCNIYDSFPENIDFYIQDIEYISHIYKVILDFNTFSELTGDGTIDIDDSLEFYKLMSSLFYIGKYYNDFNSTFPDIVYGAEACPKYQEFISLIKLDHQELIEYSKLLDDAIAILELDNFSAELAPIASSSISEIVDDYNKDKSLTNKNRLIDELKKIKAELSFINNTDLRIIQYQTNKLKQIKRQQDELARSELEKLALAKEELAKEKLAKKAIKKLQKTKKESKPKQSVAIEYDKPPINTISIFENDENTTTKLQQLEVITASKNKVEALAAKLVNSIYNLKQAQLVKLNDTPEEAENIRKMNSDIRQNKNFNFDTLTTSFGVFTSYEQFDFILEDINDLLHKMSKEDKSILQKNDFCKQRAEELKKIILDKQEEYNNSAAQLKNIHQLFETMPPKQRQSKYKMSQETINKCLSMNNVFKNVPVYIKNILSFLTYVNNNTQQTSKK